MEVLAQIQGLLIGLMGWAGTAALMLGSSRLSKAEQRALIVFSWTLWMIPAMGSLVYRNMMETSTAAFYCIGTTLFIGALVSISSIRWHTRP